MKKIFVLLFVLGIFHNSQSQTLEDTLKSNIDSFFDCMQKNDTVRIKKLLNKNCDLKSFVKIDGKTELNILPLQRFLKAIATPLEEDWEEKIINHTFLTDEIMAIVWTDYEFVYEGKVSHSGVNQFTFIRNKENGEFGWEILSIIDTRYVQMKGDLSKETHKSNNRIILNQLINDWHGNASHPDLENFFSFMGDSCIYKGTDKMERWTKSEFYGFCKPYFEKGKAWDFKPTERHISFDDNLQTAWFDEKLDTWMGVCKATGVCQKINGEWKLVLYDLSVTIDNEKIKSFIELSHEKK